MAKKFWFQDFRHNVFLIFFFARCSYWLFYFTGLTKSGKHQTRGLSSTESSTPPLWWLILVKIWVIFYKSKRCSRKEYCKQCRYVMFKGTMIKWPIKNQHTEQHKNTKTRRTPRRNIHSETQYCLCFSDFSFFFYL